MTSQEQGNSLRSRIAMTAVGIVFVHVMLCLYVIIVPPGELPKNKIITLYRQVFVLGPFFAESRIKSSHHLSVRYKSTDGWSAPRELVNENFHYFSRHPFRVDKLPFNDYEKRLSYTVGKVTPNDSFEAARKSAAFRELNAFILDEYLRNAVDSIQVVYGLDEYDPLTKKFQFDTVFSYSYNPNTIGSAKE